MPYHFIIKQPYIIIEGGVEYGISRSFSESIYQSCDVGVLCVKQWDIEGSNAVKYTKHNDVSNTNRDDNIKKSL